MQDVGSRKPLSKEAILKAAIEMADEVGLEAVSMRKLGQRLGVEAMSLYYHVKNKNALIEEMVAIIVSRMELPPQNMPWRAALETAARSACEQLVLHPWVTQQFMNPEMTNLPARFGWSDAILGCMRQAGMSVELTHHAYHALDSHIIGFAYWEAALPSAQTDREALLARFWPQLTSGDYPWLLEHVQYHQEHDHLIAPKDGEFEYTLRLILDGIERIFELERQGLD